MTMIYAILNSEGRCIDRTIWDGQSEWRPPDGYMAVPDPHGRHQIWSEPSNVAPQPDYVGFYSAVLASNTYAAVLNQPATAELARALAVFVCAIQDAMAGRENRQAMQGAIGMLLSQVALSQDNAVELQELMRLYSLDGVYALQPS